MSSRAYAERLTDGAYVPIWSPTWLHRRPLVAALRDASRWAEGRLLDVGCGNQPYRAFFQTRVSGYVGLDLPPATGTRPDVVGVGNCLPFREGSFDTVLSTQVLEHLPDPVLGVGEMSRVLRPGGHLILTVPQAWRLHEVPHDYYRFTRFGLEHVLTQQGFEVLILRPLGGAYALAGQVLLNALPVTLHRLSSDRRRALAGPVAPEPTAGPAEPREGPSASARQLLSRCVVAAINAGLNLCFGLLDAVFHDPDDTLNYLVVARKR